MMKHNGLSLPEGTGESTPSAVFDRRVDRGSVTLMLSPGLLVATTSQIFIGEHVHGAAGGAKQF